MAIKRSLIAEGDKVVEVGVGTGISLTSYPRQCKVAGIDLTRKMLDQAKRKKDRHKLDHVELLEMDAENMTFSDDTFDHAVAAFVITVVPNPEKMVSEMKRVTKKGGSIVILNHFCSDNAFISGMKKFFPPSARNGDGGPTSPSIFFQTIATSKSRKCSRRTGWTPGPS